MRTPQHHVEVKISSKSLKVDQTIVDSLKKSLSSKMIAKMKKEYVECPVANQTVPFLLCYNCVSFIRRVQGVVDCEGKEYRLKTP
ncbi:MAG: hypothetical protein QW580_00650 [Nitrososphaerota archaeon]